MPIIRIVGSNPSHIHFILQTAARPSRFPQKSASQNSHDMSALAAAFPQRMMKTFEVDGSDRREPTVTLLPPCQILELRVFRFSVLVVSLAC
jgi:hypothetical protein